MSETILELEKISKEYGGIHALNNVSFSIKKGEAHAIVGENGAGKSTLIKILTGAIEPSEGRIMYKGNWHDMMTPSIALHDGISAIYQEFNLIPYLTVAENIFFGCELMKGMFRDTELMNKKTVELCKEMGVDVNPKSQIAELGVAFQQIIEIVKSVSKETQLLIMDEPTAPLTNSERDFLYKIVEHLKKKGVTIIYISHRLEEVFDLCDRVTVLRDGCYITSSETKNTNEQELISWMVGREIDMLFPPRSSNIGETVLEVKQLCNKKLNNVSFELKKGEILGLGGLVGAGRTEVARAIYGADEIESGEVILNGEQVMISSPMQAIETGIGLIPEDRKNQGVLLELPIFTNISYSVLRKISKRFFINKKEEKEMCQSYKDSLRIKAPNLNLLVKNLSGGNQQKVAIAKVLATKCDVLIFDEPIRGIDVGAKEEIYRLMRELTENGKSILMISSEMPELLGLSDRILVMKEGAIVAELYEDEFTQENVLRCASLGKKD